MSLLAALGPINLEATQVAILAELQQKLEPGQSVVVSSVGGTVTVTGTVALDAATLAALETINVNQAGSWNVTITDGGGSITVDGTVALDAATLAALESISVTVLGTVPVSGPLTDAQLRAALVPVTGPLTDTQLRALAVAVSGTVALDAATLAALESVTVTGPLTDTQLRSTPVPVSGTVAATLAEPISVDDNGASLTTDGTYDERYGGGKLAFGTTVTLMGDTTLITPGAGQAVRVVWVSAIPSSDNSLANLMTFRFGAGSPVYTVYAASHWESLTGPVNAPFIVNCQTAEKVAITVHYRLI